MNPDKVRPYVIVLIVAAIAACLPIGAWNGNERDLPLLIGTLLYLLSKLSDEAARRAGHSNPEP